MTPEPFRIGEEPAAGLTPASLVLVARYRAFRHRDLAGIGRIWAQTGDAVIDNPFDGIRRDLPAICEVYAHLSLDQQPSTWDSTTTACTKRWRSSPRSATSAVTSAATTHSLISPYAPARSFAGLPDAGGRRTTTVSSRTLRLTDINARRTAKPGEDGMTRLQYRQHNQQGEKS